MTASRSFPLLLTLLGLLLFSCSSPTPGFLFLDSDGETLGLKVQRREGLGPDGEILLPPGQEVAFCFKKPLVVEKEGMALYLRGRGLMGDYSLSVQEKGAGTSRESRGRSISAPLPAMGGGNFKGEVEFFLALPPARYGGFAIQRSSETEESSSKPGDALEILEAGIREHCRGVLVSPRTIRASSDLNLEGDPEGLVLRFPLGGARLGEVPVLSLHPPLGEGMEIRLAGQGKTYKARIKTRPVPETFYFHPPILGFSPEILEIRGFSPEGGLELDSLPRRNWEKGAPSFDPIPLDLRLLVEGEPGWRGPDFEVFRWNLYPNILFFDTRDYGVQNRLFHRLAFFAEKKGFRGSLHRDSLIGNRHGWNAHNYSAQGLAAFFEEARRTAFPLNEMELWLGEYLLSQGTIKKSGSSYIPGHGGILSISRESGPAHRRLLLTHEIFHGIYYELPEFRQLVARTWKELPAQQKEFWTFFFSWMQYDVTDPELVVNEFQAYLLQQSPQVVDEYFKKTITSRLLARYPERQEWFQNLFRDHPRMFTEPAGIFSRYLDGVLGIQGGNVFSLYPLR